MTEIEKKKFSEWQKLKSFYPDNDKDICLFCDSQLEYQTTNFGFLSNGKKYDRIYVTVNRGTSYSPESLACLDNPGNP